MRPAAIEWPWLSERLWTALLQDTVTAEERQLGKRLNFSLVYGAGARMLAAELGTTSKEAQLFQDKYVHVVFVLVSQWGAHHSRGLNDDCFRKQGLCLLVPRK